MTVLSEAQVCKTCKADGTAPLVAGNVAWWMKCMKVRILPLKLPLLWYLQDGEIGKRTRQAVITSIQLTESSYTFEVWM